MKKTYFSLAIILISGLFFASLMSCRSSHQIRLRNQVQESEIRNKDMIFKTSVRVMPGKTFIRQKDGTGKTYPQTVDSPDQTLIVIQKNKNLVHPLPDSGVSEVLYITLDNPLQIEIGKQKEIPLTKTLFGFLAFREGAGYKTPTDGKITITRKDENVLVLEVSLRGKFISEINGKYELGVVAFQK